MTGTSPTTAHNGVIPQPVQVCYPSSPRDRFLYFSFIIALHASHFRQRAIFLGGFLLLFFLSHILSGSIEGRSSWVFVPDALASWSLEFSDRLESGRRGGSDRAMGDDDEGLVFLALHHDWGCVGGGMGGAEVGVGFRGEPWTAIYERGVGDDGLGEADRSDGVLVNN